MRKHFFLYSALVALLLSMSLFFNSGCQREVDEVINSTNPPTPIDQEKVNAGIKGIVVDENNIPVTGATVSSGGQTVSTDRYGVFSFRNISLSKNNGYVKVTKPGYFTGSRSFVTVADRIHTVRIMLLKKTNSGNFTGSAGGTINIAGGAKLVIPADAITDASGTAYSGTVNVAMTWLNPTDINFPFIMPGDLRGITTAGEERGLESFGMLGVELTGSGGQALKVASGKKAELTFPIPASIAGTAPATIDLWHFDETNGRWKQEGQAIKNGSNYIAQVSHFSFWNCDAPFPLVDICMTLTEPVHAGPLNNVQVRIKRPNGSYGYGRTDSLGNLCGKVPRNEALVLEILDQCGNVVASQNIGPFSSSTTLGTISVNIPAPNTLVISGIIQNCSNANVTSGAAVIYTAGGNSYTAPVTNGAFSLTILNCNSTTLNFSILPIDYTALQQGATVSGTGTSGTVNIGTLQACGTSASQFVELLIDGTPYNFVEPPDNLTLVDSGALNNNKKTLYASRSAGSNNSMDFTFPATSTGNFNLSACWIYLGAGMSSQQIVSANPAVTVSEFGAVTTGYIAGSFNVQMNFSGTTRTVTCNFRVRRD